jgi:hypothetical protein
MELFEKETNEQKEILNWINTHINELDLLESITYCTAVIQLVETLRPIYEAHHTKTLKIDMREQK